ncbi:MAG: radical SAM protein [Desulforhopalus sp.]
MSRAFLCSNDSIRVNRPGSRTYDKISFPVHCGIYTEIQTDDTVLHFNLNNEIIRAQQRGSGWQHPHEWLKRTACNDWVYYSTGGYTGVFEATGEYYLPNFSYPTNNLLGGRPFENEAVRQVTKTWYERLCTFRERHRRKTVDVACFLDDALRHTPQALAQKGLELHDAIGGPISVLPPDTRHVGYNVVPVTISRGCLYKCRFCKVKNSTLFEEESDAAILRQIDRLRELYGHDLYNYNSLFLGQHDALNCSPGKILFAIEAAFDKLRLQKSYLDGSNVFLFGSVTSLLNVPDDLFARLNTAADRVYINIGLEAADQETLDTIGKPVTAQRVRQAFRRIQDINDRYPTIEISANFIMDSDLPSKHYARILELIRDSLHRKKPKGSIYFSPLTFNQPSRSRLFEFNRLKIESRLPTYLYIIQRL